MWKRWKTWFGAVAISLIVAGPASGSAGVVVESVEAGRVAQRAGLQPGDILLSWARSDSLETFSASQDLHSPFDLWQLELEQESVEIEGKRQEAGFKVDISPGRWGLEARPFFDEDSLSAYREAVSLIDQGEVAAGTEGFQRLALSLDQAGDVVGACWLLQEAGARLARVKRWDASEQLYSQAAEVAETSVRDGLEGYLRHTQGKLQRELRRYADSARALELALDEWRRIGSGGLSEAETLLTRGRVALDQGQLDSAEEYLSQALRILKRRSPGGFVLAETLRHLGNAAIRRGSLRVADERLGQALAIEQGLANDGLEAAETLNFLALVAMRTGRYELADQRVRQACSIIEARAPQGKTMADCWSNRAKVAWLSEDLSDAEDFHHRALEIDEFLAPESRRTGVHLTNLAVVLSNRGELDAAETLYERALAIEEKIGPESRNVGALLNNLSIVAIGRGDYERAEAFLRRALAVKEKIAPGSVTVAVSLQNLGEVAANRGATADAERFHHRAIDIFEVHAPGGFRTAESLYELGRLAKQRGDLEAARRFHQEALDIHSRYRPGSSSEAQSFYALGETALLDDSPALAVDYLRRAVEALEAQTERLGGRQEVRAEFAATYLAYYQELVTLLVDLGRPAEAFHYLERSRARALLNLQAERELDLAASVSEKLIEERDEIEAEFDRTQAQLSKLNAASASSRFKEIRERQRELRGELALLKRRVRQQSPRLAALEYPDPFDLAEARRALDSGTLLLSYIVADEGTLLFVVRPAADSGPGLSVHRIEVGRDALTKRVSIFRSLIERSRRANVEQALVVQGGELFKVLLGPALEAIGFADRLLLSPDGPLHMLPFSTLVRSTGAKDDDASHEYLVEWKPVHKVISATVYGELSRSRRSNRADQAIQIAAFADPKVPAGLELDPAQLRVATLGGVLAGDRGYDLGPLPESREEARAIAELYGDEALVFVGDQVTEEQVEAIGKKARMFHFACHSLLDEGSPLDSSLVLSVDDEWKPGEENGLLQAWEIFENLEIDADLVTLSACQTALGKEIGGEGLVGLARAFQFAGARSVLASLWSVSDHSTTELMKRFYTELKAGKSKDAALRSAQLALLRGPASWRSPFHWAAFELIGDWN